MPAISKLSMPAEFTASQKEANALGEANDCAVKAVSIATGKPYAEVHALMKELGRKDKKGTYVEITLKAIQLLGCRYRKWGSAKKIAMVHSYPGVHAGLAGITTHHPRRFPKAWAGEADKVLLFRTSRHILCVKGGEVKDWPINKSLRVIDIYEIEV